MPSFCSFFFGFSVANNRKILRREAEDITSQLKQGRQILLVSAALLVSGMLWLTGAPSADAVVRTWDGGGADGTCGGGAGDGNKWSCAANWSADTAPTTADVATFDGTSTKNATIDAAISVQGIDINTGYSGIITQGTGATVTIGTGHYDQAAGTFTGGNSVIDINDGNFTLSGGAFTNSTGGITTERNFTVSGGTFTNTGATITFDDTSSVDDTTVTCTGSLGGTVVITKDLDGDFINSSGCNINLGASPTTTIDQDAVTEFTNNGTITIPSGTWTINDFDVSGAAAINNGTITHSGTGWDINDTVFTNSSGATITYSGTTITMERSLTQNGTFDLTGKTITFDDTSTIDDTTVTCTGSLGGTVVITKDNDGDFIVASGCSISLGADPTTTIDSSATNDLVNNGTIVIASGTWTINSTTSTGIIINAGTLTHAGSGWDINDGDLVNNSGATITYSGTTITMERSFTQSGTFDLTSKTITFDDSNSTDDTTVSCTGSLGGTVVIKKDSSGDFINASGCSISLGASPTTEVGSTFTNSGTMAIASGTWTVNGSSTFTNSGTITHSGSGWEINDTSLTNNSGATITYSGTAITMERNLTQNGTFDLTGKTITFDDSGSTDDTTVTCTGTLGGTVVITKDSSGDFIVAAGCSIDLGANPTTTISSLATNDFVNNGTVTVSAGTWTVTRNVSTAATLTNAGSITHSGSGWDFNDVNLINNSGAVITYSGTTITMEQNFTQSGTFDLSGKTITFDDTTSTHDSTITCAGILGGTVVVTKDDASDFTVAAGCSIELGANPSSILGGATTNNGTITIASGTWTINNNSAIRTFTNAGTITHSGSGWDMNDINFTNNSGATITYSGTALSTEANFTQNGTFDLTGKTLTFDGTDSDDDTTLTCGTTLQGNIVINKGTGAETIIGGNCTIAGSFTRTAGVVGDSGFARTLTVQGHFSMSTSDAFGGTALTLILGGSDDQNVTQNAGSIAGPLHINKSGGTASLTTAVTADSTLLLSAGTLDITSQTLSVGGAVIIAGGTLTGSSGTADFNGNLTLSSGTITAPSAIALAGNFNHSGGTFTHNSGTFTLDGADQTLSGATTFHNLTKTVSSAQTLTFPTGAGGKQTIAGTLRLQGASGALLSLRSATPGTQWQFDPQGTRTISYLDVQDSYNTNATEVSMFENNITDSGNNTGWTTDPPPEPDPTVPTPPSGFGGTALSSGSIQWTWTDNSSDETGFKLLDSNNNVIATIASANTTSYTETGLNAATSYTRKVVAYNNVGSSAASSAVTVTTQSASGSAPSAPELLSPANEATLSTDLPSFSFTRSTDSDDNIASYTLILNPGTGSQKTITFANPASDSSRTTDTAIISATDSRITVTLRDSELLDEGVHTWKVRATDAADNSADSDVWEFTIKLTTQESSPNPTSPVSLTPSSSTSTSTSVQIIPAAPPLMSIAQVIEQIARGEVPTRMPLDLQLSELAKQAQLQQTKKAFNLQQFLASFFPLEYIQAFDRAFAYYIDLLSQRALAFWEAGQTYIANLSGDVYIAVLTWMQDQQFLAGLEREQLPWSNYFSSLNPQSWFAWLRLQTNQILVAARSERLNLALTNEQRLNSVTTPASVWLSRVHLTSKLAIETMTGQHEKPLLISNVKIEQLTPTRAVISWETSKLTHGKINWGPTVSYGADGQGGEAFSVDLKKYHRIELTSLTPAQKLYFEVVATDANSNSTADAYYTFTTPSQK